MLRVSLLFLDKVGNAKNAQLNTISKLKINYVQW